MPSYVFDQQTAQRIIRAVRAFESNPQNLNPLRRNSRDGVGRIFARLTSRDATDKWKYGGEQVLRQADGSWATIEGGLVWDSTDNPLEERHLCIGAAATNGANDGDVIEVSYTVDEEVDAHWTFDFCSPGQIFIINIVEDGTGAAGSKTTQCTFKYTVKSRTGESLATGVTSKKRRPNLGKLSAADDDTEGKAYMDSSDAIQLWDANETLVALAC